MPQPTSAVTRWEYSATFEEFDLMMNKMRFIGARVLRPRMVAQQSANIGKVALEQLLLQRDTKRNARAGYGRDNWEFTSFDYATDEHGWEAVLDDRERKIYRDIIDAEGISAARAMHNVCEKYERAVATAVFDTAVWTGSSLTTAVGTAWSTWATATPVTDVMNAIEKVRLAGVTPNALILNAKAYRNLINVTQVVDRLRYAQVATQDAMRQAIAGMLDLDFVIVSGGLTNSANQGQSASISDIWGAYAMVAKVAVTDDPREVCIGRTFMFAEENAPQSPGADGSIAVVTEQYREDATRGDVMRARADYALEIMYPEAGHLLSNIY